MSTSLKTSLLCVLIALFYWRDLVSIWQSAFSVGWIGFTFAIALLVFIYIYQKRQALESLALISEGKGSWGAGFLGVALILYLFGSYVSYTLWFHLCSFVFFITTYLMLMLDFRIAKVLSMPLFALLFLVPLSTEDQLVWNIFLVVTLLVIVLLFASDFRLSRRLRSAFASVRKRDGGVGEEVESCSACELEVMGKEAFCLHCGRRRVKPRSVLGGRSSIFRSLALLVIVCILTFAYFPVFSVSAQGAMISSYSFYGVEQRMILGTPRGWLLNSSVRLLDYESRHGEDYVVSNDYVPWMDGWNYAGSKLSILLEVCSKSPSLMDDWRLSGWERTEVKRALLGENIAGRCVLLWEPVRNNTLPVLYWSMRLWFRADSEFLMRQVGVSVFMKFDEPLGESQVLEVFEEIEGVAHSLVNEWILIDRLTLHVSTLNRIYDQFRDLLFSAVGVVGVFLFAGWIRAGDDRTSRLSERALLLSDDEARVLLAASKMRQRKFRGVELFEEYMRLVGRKVGISRFYRRLRRLSTLGLFSSDYVVDENDELRMVWVRRIP